MSEEYVCRVLPKVDIKSAKEFEDEVSRLLEEGVTNLRFDLADTTYISSVGLRVFLKAQKALNKSGGEMVLCHVKPQVMEIFEVTGFSGIMNFE